MVATRIARYIAASGAYATLRLPVFRRERWLRNTNAWSTVQRTDWRLKKFAAIIDFAWKHVPFYREFWRDHGLHPAPIQSLEDLKSFPIVSKNIFRANALRFQPDNLKSLRWQTKHTGGTTGEPVHYLQDLDQWALMQAFHIYGWSFTGYRFGDPVAVIAGGSLMPEDLTLKDRLRTLIEGKLFLFGVHMDPALAREYHGRILRFGAKFLYGYPSILSEFGRHLADQKLSLPRLEAVVTTGEMLLQEYRESIERNLGCPVFNNLGCNDGGYESFECHLHAGLHYNDFQSILEVNQSSTGTMGELLITNLWNRSTPFIRFANGDLISLSNPLCSCGSRFPLISEVQGRTADLLKFSNGRSIAGPALTLIFAKMQIEGWQVVKTAHDKIEVRLKSEQAIPMGYEKHISDVLKQHLGNGVQVLIKRVDELRLTRAGKRKPIWTEDQKQ